MPKVIVDLPVEAGVYTEQTPRGATGKWKSADKVRFRYGLAQKIGGWIQQAGQLLGLPRRIIDWSDIAGIPWASIGTESKLYVQRSESYYDITPIRRTVNLTNPFTTVNTSTTVTVTDAAHGAKAGDYVRFDGFTLFNNFDPDGEYKIQTVPSVDTFTITSATAATGSGTGGGTGTAEYDISTGLTSSEILNGWGTGAWDSESPPTSRGWGDPSSTSTVVERLRTWSLDSWGEDLIANPRGGSIYWWDRTTGETSRAVVIDEAPVQCNFAIISQRNRHLFALGATDYFTGQFDPLLIRWCSQEDFRDWIPTSTNTAGDLRLYRGSEIIGAIRTRGEILVFTNTTVFQVTFLGGQAVYGVNAVGENVTLLGPNAAIEVDYRVFFMAEGDFYVYDGVLRPLPCDVRNLVYENLNNTESNKCFAGLNREFNEIWFFYPGKAPEVWFEDDFTTSALTELYGAQSQTGGPYFSVAFDSGGYTEATKDASSSVYSWAYLSNASAGARITTPTDWDLEATVSFTGGGSSIIWAGPIMHAVDLTGNAGTNSDNIQGLSAEIDLDLNTGRMVEYNTSGVDSAIAGTTVDFSTLPTAITLTADVEYGITLTRTPTQLIARIYDPVTDTKQIWATHTLTGQQLIDHTAGTYGFAFADDAAPTIFDPGQITQLKSMRAAPGGVLANSTGTGPAAEINRYVIYNYEEDHWSVGGLERTAWADRSPVFNKPYAAGTDNYIYVHESGNDAAGSAITATLESYDMEIPEAGENLAHIDQLIPDFIDLTGTVDIYLDAKKYPAQITYDNKGPYPITETTNKVSTRIRGRQVALRMESNDLGDMWRMGTMRIRVRPHGRRA